MDAGGNIYEIPEDEKTNPTPVTREDSARLDGYLKRRAEEDRKRHEKFVKKHGRLIWDSQTQGTYRKETNMGIEGIENLANDSVDPSPSGE